MKLLTMTEAAKILKINVHTAYRYAKEGVVPAIRVGRNWRFSEKGLEEWLTEKAGKNLGAWHRKKPEKKKKLSV